MYQTLETVRDCLGDGGESTGESIETLLGLVEAVMDLARRDLGEDAEEEEYGN